MELLPPCYKAQLDSFPDTGFWDPEWIISTRLALQSLIADYRDLDKDDGEEYIEESLNQWEANVHKMRAILHEVIDDVSGDNDPVYQRIKAQEEESDTASGWDGKAVMPDYETSFIDGYNMLDKYERELYERRGEEMHRLRRTQRTLFFVFELYPMDWPSKDTVRFLFSKFAIGHFKVFWTQVPECMTKGWKEEYGTKVTAVGFEITAFLGLAEHFLFEAKAKMYHDLATWNHVDRRPWNFLSHIDPRDPLVQPLDDWWVKPCKKGEDSMQVEEVEDSLQVN